ncbi:putative membrane protein [Echinicola vietnamensis DSM 17526]|uniref:Putative membrane protein n=1 Tax=Echinicola vietnamensis (strain DSM 17526 / LMG 23754 / KMM 6221) TaxID=926556 RepID=L0FZI0_ECHVK|nr:putative membrane protein [Echinicola vietnamensis DSM 17526]
MKRIIHKAISGGLPVVGGLILSLIMVAIAVIPIPAAHWSLAFLGKLHPLLVHLPIGVFLALVFLEFANQFVPGKPLAPACIVLLWLTVVTAIPTVVVGALLAGTGGYGSDTLVLHKWLGVATALASIWLLVYRGRQSSAANGHISYFSALAVTTILLGATGHYGGTLTHGTGFLTEDLPDDIKAFLGDDPYALDGLAMMERGEIDETLSQLEYARDIDPITASYCESCHGEKEQKGGLRLDNIDPDMVKGHDAETWRAMLNMVNSGEMPPKEEKQLSDEERRKLVDWITASIQRAVALRKADQEPVIRRLTKDQYTNTLADLLKVDVNFGEVLPDDAKSEMGFSNNGQVLGVSPLQVDYYKKIAREALDKAIAPAKKPATTRYRITFGKGIGKGKTAAMIGGYQSAPINSADFVVEVLDDQGNPKRPKDSAAMAQLEEVKRNIGVGMRGSHADRYQVVDEGIMLYSAVPHKEVTPKSWQGPSPNLKLLFRRHFPEEGDFVFRVKASRGYQWEAQKEGLIGLRNDQPAEKLETTILLLPKAGKDLQNMSMQGPWMKPKELTEHASVTFYFTAPRDGYYQVDFEHPYVGAEGMPSAELQIDEHKLQERFHFDEKMKDDASMMTPLTLAYLKAGEHKLMIGGKFFTGFSKVIVTPFPEDHPVAMQLQNEAEKSRAKYDQDVPVIRTFAGERTDDGMDYQTFDTFQNVSNETGKWKHYTFKGRLENLPIPVIDTVETEILANIMILGLWNDYLVKDNEDSGPPLLINQLEFEAPYYPQWPPASHEAIFFDSPAKNDQKAYTKEVLSSFLTRAYRRPVEQEEVATYMEFWESIRPDYARYEDGIKEVLIAALCSPNFLYLAEPKKETSEEEKEFFLASRLSYFLWNEAPDEELLELAKEEDLHKDRYLKRQVDRMIEDERIWHMVRRFSNEWLRIDRHEAMSTNVNAYPDFTRFVKKDMTEETYHFMHYILQQDLSIMNMIESDFAMLNQNLAEFYGITGVKGNHFRPVAVTPDMHRGGLLSQGAFLNGHSDGNQAHAIKRAVWVRGKILGDEPPPPPPNVPQLDPETPGFEKLTLKEQLFVHRDKPACMDCHKKIDPYGIAFENYNAVGRFETVASTGSKIDAKSELPNGEVVNGIDEIKSYILNMKQDTFTRSLVKHLFSYAMGRDVTFVDEREIEKIVSEVREANYSFRSVVENIVLSDSFKGQF